MHVGAHERPLAVSMHRVGGGLCSRHGRNLVPATRPPSGVAGVTSLVERQTHARHLIAMVSFKAIVAGALACVSSVCAFESDFAVLKGQLTQVSFDGRTLCGVNSQNAIYCATDNLDAFPNWRLLQGSLKWIVVWGEDLWGVNNNDDIFWGNARGDPAWRQLPGKLSQISTDGKQLCGVNHNNDIFCADTSLRENPNWRQLPGKLQNLVVANGIIFGTAPDQTIWTGQAQGAPSFTKISGGLVQIAYDGEMLCGVNAYNQVYCADNNLRTDPNWRRLTGFITNPDGVLRNVDIQAGRLIGVGTDQTIYRKWLTPATTVFSSWRTLNGRLRQLNFDGKSVCGVNANDDIFCATQNFELIPNWNKLSGSLHNIDVNGNLLVGANSVKDIYRSTSGVGTANWVKVPGSLVQTSTDGQYICGTNHVYNIYCSQVSGNWFLVEGANMRHVVVWNGEMYAINTNNQIFYSATLEASPKWLKLDGGLNMIDFDGKRICGVDNNHDLWCADEGIRTSSPNWYKILGSNYNWVAVSGAQLFATSTTDVIYYRMDITAIGARAAYESDWDVIPGQLVQLSFDGLNLCGVNNANAVYCANDNLDGTPNWRKLDGSLKWVTVWGDNLWGVNSDNDVFYGSSVGDANWVQLQGKFAQIVSDGKQICAINADGDAFCADEGITSSPNWRQINGNMKLGNIDLNNGALFASALVDRSLYFGMSDGLTSFTRIGGWLSQISYDGEMICGVNYLNEVWCADNNLKNTNTNWRKLPGSFTFVDLSSGRMFAIGTDGKIYRKWFTPPPTQYGNWKTPNGKLTQVDFDGESICGVTAYNDIWCSENNWDSIADWRVIPGKLTQIALWGDRLYGIDPSGALVQGNTSGDSQWRKLPGDLTQVSTDGKSVCGVTWYNDVWCGDFDSVGNVAWRVVPIKFTQVVVQNGAIFGITPSGEIYSGRSRGDPNWVKVPGQLVNLRYDGLMLCGTTVYNDIWCADDGLFTGTPNWFLVDGKLSTITTDAARIVGLNSNSDIYFRNDL
ncbi:TPA: hypothetical protein N0F65_008634 [Lagenidium giganteum]|uniref:Uncharacterized protein n=1 Tax=Lagenidium giganteum TaxID=4803 RepID=A0AAV2Z338_9STRA|nr:TPA: hypothetical protein N0F65_008634 [Lagenidium giganteum]